MVVIVLAVVGYYFMFVVDNPLLFTTDFDVGALQFNCDSKQVMERDCVGECERMNERWADWMRCIDSFWSGDCNIFELRYANSNQDFLVVLVCREESNPHFLDIAIRWRDNLRMNVIIVILSDIDKLKYLFEEE